MNRHKQDKKPMQTYTCSCDVETPLLTCKVQLKDTNEHAFSRQFLVQIPKSHLALVNHHYSKLIQDSTLPNIVTNKVVSVLQEDPTASFSEVLHDVLVCSNPHQELNQISIPQWISHENIQNGNNVFPLLIKFIGEQRLISIQNVERNFMNDTTQFQNIHGNSVQSAIQYTQLLSFTRYTRAGVQVPFFNTLQQFMEFYNFGKMDQIITIPVIPEMFEGSTFSPEQIDKANACILFTSPVHVWALHQLLSSETHKNLSVFSMDGTFPLRMARSGTDKTVIISLGFIHLDVNNNKANAHITRAFLPIVHCLSQSESSPAAYICLKGRIIFSLPIIVFPGIIN
jgi:hypothetical protein